MKTRVIQSLRLLLVMTILTGALYPVLITVLGQLAFPRKISGSLVVRDGKVIGSELIGQRFTGERYFWPRPSAIDYDPLPSGASNYGPTSDTLKKLTEERRARFIMSNGLMSETIVPAEMLFTSGSGIDPNISPDAADLQVDRVAAARRFDDSKKDRLRQLIHQLTEPRQFGVLGESCVNVLDLNLALDGL
jgi:K+-transporting ATPase ATPase C chain